MEQKPWWQSKTIISAIIAIVGVVAPRYTPLISQTAGDILAILGSSGAIVGRATAKKAVVRKKRAKKEPEVAP